MSVALDWLIIGGGIHGVHIAARLLGESGVREKLSRHEALATPRSRALGQIVFCEGCCCGRTDRVHCFQTQ